MAPTRCRAAWPRRFGRYRAVGAGLGEGAQRVAEHGLAEGAGGSDDVGAGSGQLFGARDIDAAAFFLAQKHLAAAGAAAEGAGAGAGWVGERAVSGGYRSRFLVYAAVAAQVTRVVEDGLLRRTSGAGRRVPRRASNWLWCSIEKSRRTRTSRCRWCARNGADGNQAGRFGGADGLDIGLGQPRNRQVVAQPARRIAGAFLFAQHAKTDAGVAEQARQRQYDLTSLGIVGAHAAQPQAVFLGAVEQGQGVFSMNFWRSEGANPRALPWRSRLWNSLPP